VLHFEVLIGNLQQRKVAWRMWRPMDGFVNVCVNYSVFMYTVFKS